MPRASKAILSNKELEDLFMDLSGVINSLPSKAKVAEFLDEFLTKEEKIMLSKRLTLLALLYSARPLPTIQQTLGMSNESMRKYNISARFKSEEFKNHIIKIGNKRKHKDFFAKLEKKLRPLDLAFKSRTDMRARAKLLSGDFDDHPF